LKPSELCNETYTMSSNKIIKLHALDNVGIVISNLKKGEEININEETISVVSDITFGHKIALKNVPVGDKIIKYGVPIGVSTLQIESGAHVHVHNIESLYMKQFTK